MGNGRWNRGRLQQGGRMLMLLDPHRGTPNTREIFRKWERGSCQEEISKKSHYTKKGCTITEHPKDVPKV